MREMTKCLVWGMRSGPGDIVTSAGVVLALIVLVHVVLKGNLQHTDNSLFQESGSEFLVLEEFLQHHWDLLCFQAGTVQKCGVVNTPWGNSQAMGDGSC